MILGNTNDKIAARWVLEFESIETPKGLILSSASVSANNDNNRDHSRQYLSSSIGVVSLSGSDEWKQDLLCRKDTTNTTRTKTPGASATITSSTTTKSAQQQLQQLQQQQVTQKMQDADNVFVSFLQRLFLHYYNSNHDNSHNNNNSMLNVLKILGVNISMWFHQTITIKCLLLNNKNIGVNTQNEKKKKSKGKNKNQEKVSNNLTLINIFDCLSQLSIFCALSLKHELSCNGYFEILSKNLTTLFITQNHSTLVAQTLLNKLSLFYLLFYELIERLNKRKYIFNSIHCNGETFFHGCLEMFLNVFVYLKRILRFDINRIFSRNIGGAYHIATIKTKDVFENKNSLTKLGNIDGNDSSNDKLKKIIILRVNATCGIIPLLYSFPNGRNECINTLVEYPEIDANARDQDGNSGVPVALSKSHDMGAELVRNDSRYKEISIDSYSNDLSSLAIETSGVYFLRKLLSDKEIRFNYVASKNSNVYYDQKNDTNIASVLIDKPAEEEIFSMLLNNDRFDVCSTTPMTECIASILSASNNYQLVNILICTNKFDNYGAINHQAKHGVRALVVPLLDRSKKDTLGILKILINHLFMADTSHQYYNFNTISIAIGDETDLKYGSINFTLVDFCVLKAHDDGLILLFTRRDVRCDSYLITEAITQFSQKIYDAMKRYSDNELKTDVHLGVKEMIQFL